MAADFTVRGGAMELIDRDAERDTLDRFVAAIRAGESQALVVSGEAGVGKTALLDYLAGNASGCRVARTAGVQSEMELAFAALHQLCAPMLDSLQRLPAPQRDAVRIAFGMSSGPAPDRFLVGLAVLSLLSDVAEQQPLVCLVDDEQWLDRASAQVLGLRCAPFGGGIGWHGLRGPDPEQRPGGVGGAQGRGAAGGGRASAPGFCADWTARYAGARSDPRRDSRQPAGIAGIAPGIDSAAAGRGIWPSRRGAAVGRYRRELPPAGATSSRNRPGGCC